MPVDSVPIAARLGKPGDLRHPIADRDQKHLTVSAATQANTRYLAKRYVDHAAHSQPVLVRLTVSHHGRGPLRTSRKTYSGSGSWASKGTATEPWHVRTMPQAPTWWPVAAAFSGSDSAAPVAENADTEPHDCTDTGTRPDHRVVSTARWKR